MEGTLADLVAACLSKDPAQRPTADQLIIELTGQPVPKAAIEPLTGPAVPRPAGPHAFAAPHPTVQQGGPGPQGGTEEGYTPQAAAYGPRALAGGGQPDAAPQTGPYGQAASSAVGPTVVAGPSTFAPGIPQAPGTPPGTAPGMPPAPGMPGGAPGSGSAQQGPGMGAAQGHLPGGGMPPGAPPQPGGAYGPHAGPSPGGPGQGPQGPAAHGPQGPGQGSLGALVHGPQGPGNHGQGPQGAVAHMPQGPVAHGPGSPQAAGHGPGGRGPHQAGQPGGRPDGGAGSKQRRTLTFALSGAAAAALLVVAGAVVVQANSGTQKVLSVGTTSEASPTTEETPTTVPSINLPVDTSKPNPRNVPDLDVDVPEPTKAKTRRGNDAMAQVPDTAVVPSRQPTSRPTRSPSPSPTRTVKKKVKKKNLIEPDTEPTGTPTPTIVQNPHQPTAVCGPGFKIIDRHALDDKATIFLLYNTATAKNCVVTMSRLVYPTKIHMNAVLQVQGGASASNPGKFSAYAGPIRLSAPRKCVMWGGTWESLTWKSPAWSHCS